MKKFGIVLMLNLIFIAGMTVGTALIGSPLAADDHATKYQDERRTERLVKAEEQQAKALGEVVRVLKAIEKRMPK